MPKYDSLPDITAAVDYDETEEQQEETSSSPLNYHDYEDDTDCLIHGCTRLGTPVTFLGLIVPLYTILLAAATYMGGCISTIEKQFQLSSSKSGMIATVNDIVSLCLIIFATYYGSKYHRPRLLSIGGIIVGVGYFLLAVPHFTSEPIAYDSHFVMFNDSDGTTSYVDINNKLCSSGEATEDRCASGDPDEEQPLSVIWLVIGQILIGIGSAPTFPLIITYLDDSTVDSTTTSIYIAIMFVAVAFGPLIGFLSSAKSLAMYVDFYRVDEQSIPTNPRDPRWVGAWWLGFVVFSVIIVAVSIPLFFLPRKLKKYECTCFCKRRSNIEGEPFSIKDVYNADFMQEDKGVIASIKALTVAMKRIVTNPAVVFLSLASSCDLAIVGGFAFFSAKYVEKQFAISPAIAAIVLGGINLPGFLFANILSGFCIRKFKLNQFGLSKMIATFATMSLIFAIPLLFTGCSNPDITGVTTHYNTSYNQGELPDFNSNCNSDCACPERVYKPVCGSDGMTYASACHAGCVDFDDSSQNYTIFIGCSCIDTGDVTTDGLIDGGVATEGSCDYACDKILQFAIVVALITVFAAMKPNPNLMLTLRCVDTDDRALTMAFTSVITKVIGFFPAPIYFGAVITSTCLVRQESCSREGACLVYDLERYRYGFIGVFVGLKLLAVIFAFCIYGSIDPERLEKNKSKPMELKQQANGEEELKRV